MSRELAEQKEQLVLVSGETHPQLAENIAQAMGMELGKLVLRTHPNTELYARYEESVRGKHVIAIQSHGAVNDKSINDSFHQHLEIINAARLSNAREITALAPNIAGSRQDRQSQPRESVSIGLNLRMLRLAGASGLITVDLHSPATLAAFDGPVDHLTAQPLLRAAIAENIAEDRAKYVVVSPDVGHSKNAESHARELGLAVVHMIKIRDPSDNTKIIRPSTIEGVEDKICLMLDDMIDTAGTLVSAAETLHNSGAKAIYAAATHGIFSEPGLDRLAASHIDQVIVTDTLPINLAKQQLGDRLNVVPVAGMIAASLSRIITDESVSEIFGGQNYS